MRLQHLTWREVEAHLARSPAIVLPLGSTEQHGPSGLIGTDAIVAESIAWTAAALVDDLLVGPTLALAPAQFNLDFPGTISLEAGTFAHVVGDVVESLARTGFRAIYFLNGHGANAAPTRAACHDHHQRHPRACDDDPAVRFRLRSWWELPETDALRARLYGAGEGMHATPSEISVTRAVLPGRRPRAGLAPVAPLSADYLRDHAGDAHDDARTHRRAFPDGRVGADAALANDRDGQALLETAARELVADYRRFVTGPAP